MSKTKKRPRRTQSSVKRQNATTILRVQGLIHNCTAQFNKILLNIVDLLKPTYRSAKSCHQSIRPPHRVQLQTGKVTEKATAKCIKLQKLIAAWFWNMDNSQTFFQCSCCLIRFHSHLWAGKRQLVFSVATWRSQKGDYLTTCSRQCFKNSCAKTSRLVNTGFPGLQSRKLVNQIHTL